MNYFNKLAVASFFFAWALSANAQQRVPLLVKDALQPAASASAAGFIGQRLDAVYDRRILGQDAERLVAVFSNRTETSCWQSEFWGKWFTAAVLAYRYKPGLVLKEKLDKAAAGLMATQTADGYIGNYAADKHLEQWDIWGRKYCMLGLLSYYDLTLQPAALHAAARLADHLMQELAAKKLLVVKMGNHRGMAASSVLEPITLLYTRTGDKKYLSFAEEIVRQWETPEGPQLISKSATPVGKRFPKPEHSWYGWEQGQKAYEMMSCYEGLLELYRITGKEQYKEAVVNTWQSIRNTEMNIAGSGSAAECWFGGKNYQTLSINHYQETCVTATWIKLSQQLLRLTGEAIYADAIEQTYYNALLGAMFPDGSDWAKYSPLSGIRLRGEEQCHMGLNCCEASGPRGLFTLPLTAVMKSAGGVQINFFTEGRFTVTTPAGQTAAVEQHSDYPVSGQIRLVLKLAKPEQFTISIRNPGWSQQSSITVNSAAVPIGEPASYIAINRSWKNGDTITVSLDMRGHLLRAGASNEYFAITRGPLVLARDSRLGGPAPDQPLEPLLKKDDLVDLQPAVTPLPGYWLNVQASFMVESHAEAGTHPVQLMLCDYASAGNSFDASAAFRVWLPQLLNATQLQ